VLELRRATNLSMRKRRGPIKVNLADSYGQFAELRLYQDGVIH
jgi:hypothetical protein